MSERLRVVLMGDTGAGKTGLLMAKCHEVIQAPIPSTIGTDFRILEHWKRKTLVYDISGHPRFRPVLQPYFPGADGYLVVFDLTNDASLISVKDIWLPLIEEVANKLHQVTVVGTKCDLKEQRQVSRERAMILMDELELVYYEASGVTGYNVECVFTDIVQRIIDMSR